MYSGMTPKALEWQKKVRQFVNAELIPWEVHAEMNSGELPEDIEKKHREIALSMGLAGMGISKDSGGLGLNFFEQMIIWEQLGRVTNALCWCFPEVQDWMVKNFSEYQNEKYLKPLLKGDKRECYAITEKGAGSDVDGSIEALSDSLMNLSTEEVTVKIIHRSVGMVTENDVSLAAASNAIIIAFNVNTSNEAKIQAKNDGIDIRHYSIIYKAIDEVKLALEGLLEPEKVEEVIGMAEVRDQFKIPKLGIIAGCMVVSGKVVRNAFLRVRREDEIVHEGKLTSLKRFKDDVSEVQENFECGIGIENMYDFKENDIIEVFEIKEIKRSL